MELLYQAILVLPLAGAIVAALMGKRLGEHAAEYTATILLCVTALLSIGAFLFDLPRFELNKPQIFTLFQFIDSGTLQVDWTIRVDALTSVMLVVVTGVSSLVHVYSIGYMHHDEHRPRFFAHFIMREVFSSMPFWALMTTTAVSTAASAWPQRRVHAAGAGTATFWRAAPLICAQFAARAGAGGSSSRGSSSSRRRGAAGAARRRAIERRSAELGPQEI